MSASCYHCGKSSMYGRSHTHRRGVAGGRWKKRAQKTQRVFKANLQRATIIDNSKRVQVRLCSKCIKRIKFDVEKGKKPFLTLVNLVFTKSETGKVVKSDDLKDQKNVS